MQTGTTHNQFSTGRTGLSNGNGIIITSLEVRHVRSQLRLKTRKEMTYIPLKVEMESDRSDGGCDKQRTATTYKRQSCSSQLEVERVGDMSDCGCDYTMGEGTTYGAITSTTLGQRLALKAKRFRLQL